MAKTATNRPNIPFAVKADQLSSAELQVEITRDGIRAARESLERAALFEANTQDYAHYTNMALRDALTAIGGAMNGLNHLVRALQSEDAHTSRNDRRVKEVRS